MAVEKALLKIEDYVIVGLMLIISAGIGVYFRFAGDKQKTTDDYLLAGKNMSILPVSFSLMASLISAINIFGLPAEMYTFGTHFAYVNIGSVFGTFLSAYLFLPVFFNVGGCTSYEYLEKRFGKLIRTLCSLAFVVQMILYTSIVLYMPILALSAVTNLSMWYALVAVGLICTFYCTIGGMKAVLWTDVFQAIFMYLCVFTIIIKGCLDVGGIANVFKISAENGRLQIPSFSLDPTVRYTMWNTLISGVIFSMAAYGGCQIQIQRLLTVKNISRSKKALFYSIPVSLVFQLLNFLSGLVIYANFYQCDPMTSPEKPITSADQLVPYYIMKSVGYLPGLPGLCISGIFSASLSTVSSAVNSLAAVTMEDFVRPFCSSYRLFNIKAAFFAKALTSFYGLLCVLLTLLIARFGSIVQITVIIYSMLAGPVFAVFVLGMLTTRANHKGAVIGFVTSIIITAWISFGASAWAPPPLTLPVSTSGCEMSDNVTASQWIMMTSSENVTAPLIDLNTTEAIITEDLERYVFPLYRISYLWFVTIGLGIVVVVGYLASIIVDSITGDFAAVPMEYLSPVLRWFIEKEDSSGTKNISVQSTDDAQLLDRNPQAEDTLLDRKPQETQEVELQQF